jgi:origin recognition complex subunit 2
VDHFLDGNEPPQENHNALMDELPRVGVTTPSMIATHEIVWRATRIARSLAIKQKEQRQPLFLVLHNVDGPSLCSRDIQEALAGLVAHSIIESGVNAVRLVASIDLVNASALLWDNRTAANFSFVWKEVHTYRPYVEELAVGAVQDELKRHRSKKRQVDNMEDATLWNVLASLAPRHAEVVKILATLQSENLKAVDHAALLRNCKHKMTVTNDNTLRAYLAELKDHGIVETGKDQSTGREWLRIPHSREKLLEIRDFEMEY